MSRVPDWCAVNLFALDPCHINARFGAGGKNRPGRGDSFGSRRGSATAARRKHDVSETAAATIENNVLDLPHILAPRILDLGTDDGAALDVARGCGGAGAGAGLSKQGSGGETQKRQGSEQDILFHNVVSKSDGLRACLIQSRRKSFARRDLFGWAKTDAERKSA
jgi:hypothetical protein